MNIMIDYHKLIIDTLKAQGYRPGGTLDGGLARVFHDGPATVVVVPPVPLKVPRGMFMDQPSDPQAMLEAFLRRLQGGLEGLVRENRRPIKVFFMGGGTTPLSESFRAAMEEMGIEIVILDPEEILAGRLENYVR